MFDSNPRTVGSRGIHSVTSVTRICAVGLILVGSQVDAHHAFNAVFAMDTPVEIHGTVTRFDFINPHGFIYLDVTAESGDVAQWKVEITNPNALLRAGWTKDTLKPGDVINVNGPRARDGSNYAMGRAITLPDGREIFGTSPNAER